MSVNLDSDDDMDSVDYATGKTDSVSLIIGMDEEITNGAVSTSPIFSKKTNNISSNHSTSDSSGDSSSDSEDE